MTNILLRVRASKQRSTKEKEAERGPIYMEPAIAGLHSLAAKDATVMLETGMGRDGKIGFFVRATEGAAALAESQLYAQYPNIDIEREQEDPFLLKEGEEAVYCDLVLSDPEIFPIKRHPQFDDMLTKLNVDSIAGITSTLARYPLPGMRGHVSIIMHPREDRFRRRALKQLKGIGNYSSLSPTLGKSYAKVVLARGPKRIVLWPFAMMMRLLRFGFSIAQTTTLEPPDKQSLSFESTDEAAQDADRASSRSHDRENALGGAQDKLNRLLFSCNVRLSVIAPKGKRKEALQKLTEIAGSFRQFALPQSNAFKAREPKTAEQIPQGFQGGTFALSVEEIATLWHVPTILVQTPNIDWVISKKLEPPINLPMPGVTDPEDQLTTLGEAVFRGQRSRFGIRTEDRRRHIYSIGKTGMGKSTLLENMVFSDIHAGRGIGVIDPHGDLIEAILRFIPKERSNDVVLFNPADKDFPISFNILECNDPDQRTLVASGIMSVFTKLWPDVWSGRMEHILRNTLLALLESEGSSMLGIMRMFSDDVYRSKVVAHVQDPLVKSFWLDEYASWSEKYRTEAISAIQNKVGQLLSTPLIRNIVGQVKSSLDLRHAMDSGKIILVNLSKGKLGEDTSAFLGSMLVTKFQIDAMSRADIPEKDRRDFFLYVDEFQNFATESFATILSEARKYRLSLTMANQYVAQLLIGEKSTKLRDAVFGNVGSLISFQVGSDDAEDLSMQFEEAATPNDILSLPKYHAYARLMIDGVPSKPFSVTTLPPPVFEQDEGRIEVIRRLSRERYAEKRAIVEEKISRWAASAAEGRKGAKSAEKSKEKEEEEKKKAKAKGMSLEEYRKWRDREMWMNDFNALRKKSMLGEELSADEQKTMKELEAKLEKSGGVPPPSKTLLEQVGKKKTK